MSVDDLEAKLYRFGMFRQEWRDEILRIFANQCGKELIRGFLAGALTGALLTVAMMKQSG